MKSLLNPAIARQQVQPPLTALESALTQNPFAFSKRNEMFVPVNNQPVSVSSVAFFLQQALLGSAYLAVSPTAVLDSELIEIINSNRQRNGFKKQSRNKPKSEELTDEIDENEIDNEYTDYFDEVPSERSSSEEQHGIQLLAPDFYALPKSRRLRIATLGSLGYQN